ncbi:hypothetical protein SEA_SATIS_36 [Streptomyces phage Satis]|nr:hypothetical protein SEA_SATIS_36 [Streptomyces phage Satis]QBZ71935.1 hypothetical protein SEA_KRADAL_36 [Streptomyces phage Kradal]QPL14353.1 hypothetical protein SEA_EHYELIMAYOE_36 [Streptomyces phage EhyElimayoE]
MSKDEKTTGNEDTINVPIPGTELEPADPKRIEKLTKEMADVRAAMETLGRSLAVAQEDYKALRLIVMGDEESTVHACPPDGSGIMPCCGRTPMDVPLTERISLDGTTVTCRGVRP